MTYDYTIFIGTVGNGLQVSRDRGESWTATPVGGLEGNVRTVAVYPGDPHRLLAGSDQAGLYRSDDNGATWSRLDSPMEGMEIWSIDVDPEDECNIYVGTRPEGFPDTLFVGTGNTIPGEIGGIQRSRDKPRREFGHVRAVAITPT